MKVLYFGRYVDCPLRIDCVRDCKGRCERLELFEEHIQEDANEVLAGMRENGDWDGDDYEDINYNEEYDG